VLSAQDPDGTAAALQVEVGPVTGGRFEAVDAPGVAIDHFSVAALQSGQIRFVATALSQAPTVTLRVSDGSASSPWTTVGVEWTPAAPAPAASPQPELEPPPRLTIPAPIPGDPRTAERLATATPTLSGDRLPLSREVRAVAAEEWLAQVRAASSADIAALSAQARPSVAGATSTPHAGEPPLAPDPLSLVMPDTALAALQAGYDLPAALGRGTTGWPTIGSDGLGLLRADLADEAGRLQSAIDPIEASGLALTVGLVWWTVRLGGVAGSLLVSVPTWQFFDPLPVLTRPPLVRAPRRDTDPAGPDPQNEEAAAAEVLGRDSTPATGEASEADDSIDTPTAAGKGARR
jgi:hypothetical protein